MHQQPPKMPLCRCTSASNADQVSGLRGAMVYDSVAMTHLIRVGLARTSSWLLCAGTDAGTRPGTTKGPGTRSAVQYANGLISEAASDHGSHHWVSPECRPSAA